MGGCFSARTDEQPKHASAKVRPSDEDRGRWAGEFDVNTKAAAFIARIHETRAVDLKSREKFVVGHEVDRAKCCN